ncbi:hypothetical protein Hamer_G021308 [Homarus americanus]|uniref:K Homology domain-containing protein n=1 Tax=Homarus americanus TaxID=6706 RepID=A0A8J5JN03_HOMAM|nr:hypothetical protein Hamer_G021308 [Homarus americanus]
MGEKRSVLGWPEGDEPATITTPQQPSQLHNNHHNSTTTITTPQQPSQLHNNHHNSTTTPTNLHYTTRPSQQQFFDQHLFTHSCRRATSGRGTQPRLILAWLYVFPPLVPPLVPKILRRNSVASAPPPGAAVFTSRLVSSRLVLWWNPADQFLKFQPQISANLNPSCGHSQQDRQPTQGERRDRRTVTKVDQKSRPVAPWVSRMREQWVSETVSETVKAANCLFGAVVGPGGSTVKDLQDTHKVRVRIPRKGSKDEPIVVEGKNKTKVKEAVLHIRSLIDQEERRQVNNTPVTQILCIPKALHGKIIGHQGQNIRYFTQTYNIKIRVPKKTEKSNQITITGLADRVEEGLTADNSFRQSIRGHPPVHVLPIKVGLCIAWRPPSHMGRQFTSTENFADVPHLPHSPPRESSRFNLLT